MENLKFKKLQIQALSEVASRISDVDNASMAVRIGEIDSLHIAAYMDIEKTTESLKNVLAYKKEIAQRMLECSDENQMENIAQLLVHADGLIKKILGVSGYNSRNS